MTNLIFHSDKAITRRLTLYIAAVAVAVVGVFGGIGIANASSDERGSVPYMGAPGVDPVPSVPPGSGYEVGPAPGMGAPGVDPVPSVPAS